MVDLITWVAIIIGFILIMTALVGFKRPNEAEISNNVTSLPQFKIGAVLIVLGFIAKIIINFI